VLKRRASPAPSTGGVEARALPAAEEERAEECARAEWPTRGGAARVFGNRAGESVKEGVHGD